MRKCLGKWHENRQNYPQILILIYTDSSGIRRFQVLYIRILLAANSTVFEKRSICDDLFHLFFSFFEIRLIVSADHRFVRRKRNLKNSFLYSRSGRRSFVRAKDCARLHFRISAWLPESRTSGTLRPMKTSGLVYCGYSRSFKESSSSFGW